MSELVWTCEEGSIFSSEVDGLRLQVMRAPVGGGFRYQLLRSATSAEPRISIASGYRGELRDAIAAAERAARSFAPATGRSRLYA